MFDVDRIAASPAIAMLDHHTAIASTNDWAKQLANDEDAELPLLVLADQQTAGRGRGANRWWSPPGSLTFSLLFNPAARGLRGERLPALSLATALAVCEAVEQVASTRLAIKWPNDIVDSHRRKAAGILLESPRTDRMIIGIGVNLLSVPEGFDELNERGVASIAELAGRAIDPTEALLAILEHLDRVITRLAEEDPQLPTDWAARNALRDTLVTLDINGERVGGHCEGFSPTGALRLNNGTVVTEHLTGSVLTIH